MKITTRILSLFLCVSMTATVFSTPVFAEGMEAEESSVVLETENTEDAKADVETEPSNDDDKTDGSEGGDITSDNDEDSDKNDPADEGDDDSSKEEITVGEITGLLVTPITNYGASKTKPYLYLSWDAVEGADGYYVWRSTTEGVFPDEPHITRTKTDYSNSSVKKGVTYYYKVAAFKNVVIEDGDDSEGSVSEIVVGPDSEEIQGTILSSCTNRTYGRSSKAGR